MKTSALSKLHVYLNRYTCQRILIFATVAVLQCALCWKNIMIPFNYHYCNWFSKSGTFRVHFRGPQAFWRPKEGCQRLSVQSFFSKNRKNENGSFKYRKNIISVRCTLFAKNEYAHQCYTSNKTSCTSLSSTGHEL